jgi:hypothetical protein
MANAEVPQQVVHSFLMVAFRGRRWRVHSEVMMKLAMPVLVVLAAACGGACIEPCPLAVAMQLTVTSAATGAALSGASVIANGDSAHAIACNGTCSVGNVAGRYDLVIRATGFQPATRSVTVTGRPAPKCGCAGLDRQDLTVALVPVSAP